MLPAVLTVALAAAPDGRQAQAPAMPEPPAALLELTEGAYDAAFNLDHDVARDLARRAVSMYPDEPSARRTLASVLWLEIMFLRGTVTVDHFMGGLNKSKDVLPPTPPDIHTEFTTTLEEAKSLADARLDDDGDDMMARHDLGAAYAIEASYTASVEGSTTAAFGAARRAYDAEDKVLKRHPEYGKAGVVVGTYRYIVSTMPFPKRWFAYVFGMRGDKERGIAIIQAAAADERAFVNAQSALLLIFTREERYEEALAAARALMRAKPRNRLFVLEAGAAATRADELDEAERLLNEGLAAFERDPRPKALGEAALWYYKRGAARLLDDRLEDAGNDLAMALDSQPIEWVRGRIHTELGKLADLEGRRPDALAAYRLAREIADDNDDPMGEDEAKRWLSRPFSLPERGQPGAPRPPAPMAARGLSGNAKPAEIVR
jgi:hypothetical protein